MTSKVNWIELTRGLPNKTTTGLLLSVAYGLSTNPVTCASSFVNLCEKVGIALNSVSTVGQYSDNPDVRYCYLKMITHIHNLAVKYISDPRVEINTGECIVFSSGFCDVRASGFERCLPALLVLKEPLQGAYRCEYRKIKVGSIEFFLRTSLTICDLEKDKVALDGFKQFYQDLLAMEGMDYYKERYQGEINKLNRISEAIKQEVYDLVISFGVTVGYARGRV